MARRRRGLVAVWAVLAVLVVAITALEVSDRRAPTGADVDSRRLLPLPVEDLGAVEIADRGRVHRFERDASGAWFYHGAHAAAEGAHTHVPDPALAARIDQALAAFARTRVERQFPLDRGGAAYGLSAPETVVLLYRRQQPQPLAQFAVGTMAPDTASRYVMRVGTPVVMTIANYQVENLQLLVRAAADTSATAGRQ